MPRFARLVPAAFACCLAAMGAAPSAAEPPFAPPESAQPESAQPESSRQDRAAFQRIVSQCRGKESFSDPAPPARIFGNVFYVGTCNVTALLITSPLGHVLIDAPTHEAAPAILGNIRALGFRVRDVRWILLSHEHFDHAGGLADIVRATGAKVAARAAMVPVLTSGKVDPADPQAQKIAGFAPVRVSRIVRDGQVVKLAGLAFTASATPGHTAGSTSWTWRSCAEGDCRRFDYVDSISALALGTYRISAHPELVATFRRTFAAIAARPCGVLLTPHPQASAMFERFTGAKPLATPGDCRDYAAAGAARLDALLANEAAATAR